ncbi:MAG: RuvX/YqgF family protein [Candidatus Eisenbacteria bacterium]|nr:RuvX/YqgF family protein [Candidatus Eisenbacteria bacterium]
MARILAVDWGARRIGLAVSDPLGILATGLPTLVVQGEAEAVARVADTVREVEANGSRPRSRSGDCTRRGRARRARRVRSTRGPRWPCSRAGWPRPATRTNRAGRTTRSDGPQGRQAVAHAGASGHRRPRRPLDRPGLPAAALGVVAAARCPAGPGLRPVPARRLEARRRAPHGGHRARHLAARHRPRAAARGRDPQPGRLPPARARHAPGP